MRTAVVIGLGLGLSLGLGLGLGCKRERASAPAAPVVADAVVRRDAAPAIAAGVDARSGADAGGTPASPSAATGAADDWVDVARAIPDAVLDIRYATADNFTQTKLYPVARCLLRREVADRLARAAAALRAKGRRVVLWDCYRPAALQRVMWERVKDPRYVAEPTYDATGKPLTGSRHSRGGAVDIALADAAGTLLPMPTAHDDFSKAAHRDRAAASPAAAELATLDAAMTAAGFVGMPTEWWHYDAKDAERFPLADVALDAVP